MAEVKMVNANFTGGWGEDICNELKAFLKVSESCYSKESYYYRSKSMQGVSEEEYKIFVASDEFKTIDYYDSQKVIMQYEDFINVKFVMQDESRLRSESVFKLNVNVSASSIFETIETHTALMAKQFEQLAKLSTQSFNEKINVPNMDPFIAKMNQTMLLEDCCTDFLQSNIAKGWRIIAICPQPNQRRPDYILGKILDYGEIKTSALRGD